MNIPNFKIAVNPETSRIIQQKVFELGGSWQFGQQVIIHENDSYLFYEPSGMSSCDAAHDYNESSLPEYTFRELYLIFFSPTNNEPIEREQSRIPNFKVAVNSHSSAMIQRRVFQLGGTWRSGQRVVTYEDRPYLLYDTEEDMHAFNQYDYYNASTLPEYQANTLIRTLDNLIFTQEPPTEREPEPQDSKEWKHIDSIIEKLQDLTKY